MWYRQIKGRSWWPFGRVYEVAEVREFRDDERGITLVFKPGNTWDGPTGVPRPGNSLMWASLVHDTLYAGRITSRKVADEIFVELATLNPLIRLGWKLVLPVRRWMWRTW